MSSNSSRKPNWSLPILLCLTLGLAPFYPEPHLWGKIKWIWGGANGMQALDWFDFLMHGSPWFYLIYLIISQTFRTTSPSQR